MHAYPARDEQRQVARELDGVAEALFPHHQHGLRLALAAPGGDRLGARGPGARDAGEGLGQQVEAHLVGVPGLGPEAGLEQAADEGGADGGVAGRERAHAAKGGDGLEDAARGAGLVGQGEEGGYVCHRGLRGGRCPAPSPRMARGGSAAPNPALI